MSADEAFERWWADQNQTIGKATARACWDYWDSIYDTHLAFYHLVVKERDFERVRNQRLENFIQEKID